MVTLTGFSISYSDKLIIALGFRKLEVDWIDIFNKISLVVDESSNSSELEKKVIEIFVKKIVEK